MKTLIVDATIKTLTYRDKTIYAWTNLLTGEVIECNDLAKLLRQLERLAKKGTIT